MNENDLHKGCFTWTNLTYNVYLRGRLFNNIVPDHLVGQKALESQPF